MCDISVLTLLVPLHAAHSGHQVRIAAKIPKIEPNVASVVPVEPHARSKGTHKNKYRKKRSQLKCLPRPRQAGQGISAVHADEVAPLDESATLLDDTGAPQERHAAAKLLISFPHSLHFINDIGDPPRKFERVYPKNTLQPFDKSRFHLYCEGDDGSSIFHFDARFPAFVELTMVMKASAMACHAEKSERLNLGIWYADPHAL